MIDNARDDLVREEFTRQAELFAAAPQMRDEDALRTLVELTEAGPGDNALDVACGPGIVTCALAEIVDHASGIDITPAMIEQARSLQKSKRLSNVSWHVGNVSELPFGDAVFSIVTSRYAFHHLEKPQAVMAEMARVAAPDGRLALVDVVASPDPGRADAFNAMERLRDPSHVRAMPLEELRALFVGAGLGVIETLLYRLDFDVDALVQGSFPAGGDRAGLMKIFRESIATDALGMNTRESEGRLICSYPIVAILGGR